MKKSNITKAISIAMLFACHAAVAQASWKLTKSKNGIAVYQSENEISKNLNSKVEFTVKRSPGDIINCITNFDNYKKWNSNCIQSKLVKKIDDSNWIYYSVFSAPFIQDRELYAKVTLQTTDKKTYKVHIEACPKLMPVNEKFVRIHTFYCDYILETSGSNNTQVTVTTSLDMGGNLSPAMVNKFSAGSLYNSFSNLCSQLGI